MNPTGVVHDLPNADYHAGPGLSHSGAKRLRRSPLHYFALAQDRTAPPKAATPQMQNGTLVHCALLEPAQFAKRYVVGPDVHKATKEWKGFLADATAAGLEPITQVQWDAAFRQAMALRALPEVADLLAEGEAEVSAYWTDSETDVLCKCRPDWVSPARHGASVTLLDVKTCADASPEGFARAVANLGYHTQADWYTDGYAHASGKDVEGFVFAAVESEFPHVAAVYMLSDVALAYARNANRAARALFARCTTANAWPGYQAGVTVLDLPAWAERDAA